MSEEQRAPMLSDERMDWIDERFWGHAAWVRDFYEAKIASGELRVVNKVRGETKGNSEGSWLHCSGCNEVWSTNAYRHCPGCGAKIIKP